MVGCEDQIDTLEARLETLTAQVDELLYQLEDHEDEIHLVARLEGRHDWAVRLIAGLHDRAGRDWERKMQQAEKALDDLKQTICACTPQDWSNVVLTLPGARQ